MARHAKPRTRRLIKAALALCAATAAGGAAAVFVHAGAHGAALARTAAPAPQPVTDSTAPAGTGTGTHPVSLAIPAIHVDTTLQDLGLTAAGALAPPTDFTQAGWYTGSPVPGSAGPSVIAGHVDSTAGPAVFFGLRFLKPGDTVTVALSSGSTVAFTVTAVERYPKDAFPTARVYGARPDAELRLITCGGSFSAGHYADNVVVYAHLA